MFPALRVGVRKFVFAKCRKPNPVRFANGCAYLLLKGGKEAIIDEADYELVKGIRWFASKHRYVTYVFANLRGRKGGGLGLHTYLMGREHCDHKSRDGLDNRRDNLRAVSTSINQANQRRQKNNTSGFIGVYRARGRWRASVANSFLGYFDDVEEAARVRDVAALKLYGTGCTLNFPERAFAE